MHEERELSQPLCSVTKELVQKVASFNKELFYTSKGIRVIPVLYALGFDVSDLSKLNVLPDVLVRTSNKPYEVYNTTLYNGRVRKEVIGFDKVNKKAIYHKSNNHSLTPLYIKKEVLTTSDIGDIMVFNICDIGDKEYYDKGCDRVTQRASAEEAERRVVRNSEPNLTMNIKETWFIQ